MNHDRMEIYIDQCLMFVWLIYTIFRLLCLRTVRARACVCVNENHLQQQREPDIQSKAIHSTKLKKKKKQKSNILKCFRHKEANEKVRRTHIYQNKTPKRERDGMENIEDTSAALKRFNSSCSFLCSYHFIHICW